MDGTLWSAVSNAARSAAAWIGSIAGGAEGRAHMADPRLYDAVPDQAQFLPTELERLQAANPDIGDGQDEHHLPGLPEWAPEQDIKIQWEHADWQGIDGLWEERFMVGQSDEGWHYSIQTSYQGSDTGVDITSIAYDSRDEALTKGLAEKARILAPIEQEAEDREAREIAEFEARMARERAEGDLER